MAPTPGPQGGLRVTRCDEEEDTEAGPGPGQVALVSLLGSWPLRQVQETDRQGEAEQDVSTNTNSYFIRDKYRHFT